MWLRIKQALRNFMVGRHGVDQLSRDLIKVGFVFFLLSIVLSFFQNNVMSIIGLVFGYITWIMYIISLFRSFSRNNTKREQENRKYLSWREKVRTAYRQAVKRFKNRKEFKYFRCPNCKQWLRMPRGKGTVTVCCHKCETHFTQKS